MDAAMRAHLQWDQTNSNLLLCNLKLSYKYQGSFLQTIKTLVINLKLLTYINLFTLIHIKLLTSSKATRLRIRIQGGHFVFIIFFIFANIQNFSKVGQATKSLELGSKKTLQLFITSFIFANNKKFQKIRLD